ncbi:MAG: Crp/Fnr family transcriptional regulator [Solobacterium sp.]|nr:Crp/Fnr family transcriptional regulator [Solobacterium sp.]
MNLHASTSPWISGDLDSLALLTAGRQTSLFRKDTTVYYQGDDAEEIFIVKTGRVRITTYAENGLEKQVFIAEKGALFGELSIFVDNVYRCSAVAIVDSEIYRIPVSDLVNTLQKDWNTTVYFIRSLCRKGLTFEQEILDLSFMQATHRTVKTLLNLCDQYGTPCRIDGQDGIRINIRFSHQDVANLIGSNRVTVSNIFSDLAKDGILTKDSGRYVVLDRQRLLDLLDQEAEV